MMYKNPSKIMLQDWTDEVALALLAIGLVKWKGKGTYLKQKDYFDTLFKGPIDLVMIPKWLELLDIYDEESGFKRNEYSDQEIFDKFRKFHEQVSKDLSKGTLDINKIKEQIEKLKS